MRQYQNSIINQLGAPVGSATVTVRVANGSGTGALATIYSDNGTTTIAGSQVTTSALGEFSFYAPDGRYDLVITKTGATTKTILDVEISDVIQANSADSEWNAFKLNDIRFADQASGASVTAKIDAAQTDLGGSPGLVVIPSSMGSGNSAGILDNCRVLDLRAASGPNQYGQEAQAYLKDVLLRARWTAAPNSAQNYQGFRVYAEPFSGGYNTTGGPKTNYTILSGYMTSRTQGQHNGLVGQCNNFGQGDTQAVVGVAESWGGRNAGGDEGTVGGRFATRQGNAVPTGTVGSVSSNTITCSALTEGRMMGELRPLINTNSGVYTTGTISSIAGTPPVVTGSGTLWQTQFGAGAKTNLFFHLDSEVFNGLKLVIPVASVDSETQITLSCTNAGANAAWPGVGTTGNYKIYKGSNVTAVSADIASSSTAQITVVDGTQFAATNTFEQPLDYRYHFEAVKIDYAQYVPSSSGTNSLGWGSIITATSLSNALRVRNGIVFSGNIARPFEYSPVGGAPAPQYLFLGNNGSYAGTIAFGLNSTTDNENLVLFDVQRNAATTGTARLRYTKSGERFFFTNSSGTEIMSVSSTGANAAIGSAPDSTIALKIVPDSGDVAIQARGQVQAPRLNDIRIVDGVTLTTIQAAIDDLPSTGGTVFLPNGTYTISTALDFGSKPVILQGSGWHSSTTSATFGSGSYPNAITGTVIKVTSTNDAFALTGTKYFTAIRDVAFVGPGSGSSVGVNYDGTSLTYHDLYNVGIFNFATGLRLKNILDCDFARLVICGCTTGIATNTVANEIDFYSLRMGGNTTAISVPVAAGLRFYGGLIQANTNGVLFVPASGSIGNFSFNGIWFEANTNYDVKFDATNGAITDTHFVNARHAGTGAMIATAGGNSIDRISFTGVQASAVDITIPAGNYAWSFNSSKFASVTDSTGAASFQNDNTIGTKLGRRNVKALALANGANNNIDPGNNEYLRITGPTGAFNITGFTGGYDGRRLEIYNTTSQTMTITNDATSTAANRILTLTGADIVLRATAPSFATLVYDGTGSRWIVEATN